MNLEIQRFSHKKAVLGLMFEVETIANHIVEFVPSRKKPVNWFKLSENKKRNFLCFTLEPADKIIPAGTYQMKLRTVGGKHNRYKAKFFNIHKGMLWVTKVPGRRFILIHIGNFCKDSQGCTLVGNMCYENTVSYSTDAYTKIYPKIAKAIENEDVFITYKDI